MVQNSWYWEVLFCQNEHLFICSAESTSQGRDLYIVLLQEDYTPSYLREIQLLETKSINFFKENFARQL
jgi:hypothetical protein